MKFQGFSALIVAVLLLSCSKAERYENAKADEIAANTTEIADAAIEAAANNAAPVAPTASTKDAYAGLNRNVIKKASFRFRVNDVHKSAGTIETLILKWPAYIESSNLIQEQGSLESKMTIRIQNEYFGECLNAISKQAASIDFKNVTSDDVSKEFVDLESRLRTKREVEARYMQILRNKAGTIEEVLQAEQQIGSLHEEIEATVQRLNYLKNQVGYSTISLEFYQPLVTVQTTVEDEKQPFVEAFKEAFKTGWTVLTTLVLALVYIWPLLLVGGIVIAVLRFRKRKLSVSNLK